MIISLLKALFLRFRPTKVMENATVQDCFLGINSCVLPMKPGNRGYCRGTGTNSTQVTAYVVILFDGDVPQELVSISDD